MSGGCVVSLFMVCLSTRRRTRAREMYRFVPVRSQIVPLLVYDPLLAYVVLYRFVPQAFRFCTDSFRCLLRGHPGAVLRGPCAGLVGEGRGAPSAPRPRPHQLPRAGVLTLLPAAQKVYPRLDVGGWPVRRGAAGKEGGDAGPTHATTSACGRPFGSFRFCIWRLRGSSRAAGGGATPAGSGRSRQPRKNDISVSC